MSIPIIDAHAHLGPWPRFGTDGEDIASMLRLMDFLNIDFTIAAHHAGLAGLLQDAEKLSRQAYDESGGRIRSYLVFDPHRPELSLEIVRRSIGERFFAGLKLHPSFFNCPADDRRYCEAWQLAQEAKLVVLVHTWGRSADNPAQNAAFPALLEGYMRQSPDAKVILGHAGGRPDGFDAATALARKCPNAYLDLTGDGFIRGRVERFVREVSAQRVLFGTDAPWIDPRFPLGEVMAADLTDDDRAAILGGNAARLFGLEATQ